MGLLTASALSRLHTCDRAQRSLTCRYGSIASNSSSGRSRTAVLATRLVLVSLATQNELPAILLPFLSTHSLRCCCGGWTMVAIGRCLVTNLSRVPMPLPCGDRLSAKTDISLHGSTLEILHPLRFPHATAHLTWYALTGLPRICMSLSALGTYTAHASVNGHPELGYPGHHDGYWLTLYLCSRCSHLGTALIPS